MYATKLSAFNTVGTFASLVLKSQKEIWDVTDSIKIPQGSRKSEGNESLRVFIQTGLFRLIRCWSPWVLHTILC